MQVKKFYAELLIYILIYALLMHFLPEKYLSIGKNGMSILGFLFALIILIVGYRENRVNKFYRVFLIGLAVNNAIADALWLYTSEIKGIADVPTLDWSTLFYIFANLCLVLSVYSLVRESFDRWNKLRLLMETSILGGIFCYLAITIFIQYFMKQIITVEGDELKYIVQIYYVVADFLVMFGLLLIYIFDKKYISDFLGKMEITGYILWTITDLFYIYQDMKGIYIESKLLGIMWAVAIIIIAISTSRNKKIELGSDDNYYSKVEKIYMIIMLAVAVLYYFDRDIPIVIITFLIFLRCIMARQLRLYEENEVLTKKYQESNEQLYKLANVDTLTKIFNRRKLMEELENLSKKNGPARRSALLFIDIDRFKSINDWYGHEMGDLLLVEVAERLKAVTRESDILARQGGDEFIILLNNIKDKNEIQEISYRIVDSFKKPFFLEGKTLVATVSVGGALYPDDSDYYYNLMKFADISLYEAKLAGKNRAVMYNDRMNSEANRKLEIENRLYEAIDKNELKVYYQPQIDTVSKKIIGIEALARWTNKDLGAVGPNEFIPVAEENGFIIEIGDFVFNRATTDIKYLNEKYGLDIKVGVNVSPKQFHTSEITYKIEKLIKEKELNPKWIDVEITEDITMNQEAKALEKLYKLKEIGVQISIDDFGTGYSSLIYLKKFPVDTLKIAIEFIKGITKDSQDYKIVEAIMAMCSKLEIKSIAEGVEDESQLEILEKLSCDQIQGYYFSKPLSLSELEEQFKTTDRYKLK